ncbi:hypothetical protein QE152_g6312 [Popillia japonica]|uniref:Uncharacterized protein n=1 Tax=Popillia japonica TaxID=7064 RepID=A0AAW1ML62_POPJA
MTSYSVPRTQTRKEIWLLCYYDLDTSFVFGETEGTVVHGPITDDNTEPDMPTMLQIPHSCSVKQKEPSYTARLPTTTPSPTCQSYESATSHSKTPSSTSTLPLGASVSQSNLYGNTSHYANIQPESAVQYSNLPNLRTQQHSPLPRMPPAPVTSLPLMSTNLVPKGYNRKADQHVRRLR